MDQNDTVNAAKEVPNAAEGAKAADEGDPAQGAVKTPTRSSPPGSGVSLLALIATLLALALTAMLWYDARQRIGDTQDELARRLRSIESRSRDADSVSGQSRDALRELRSTVTKIEARLVESQSQQLALETMYQDLSRNRDELQLSEIEQVLAIASQQLQLSGNVRSALLALQMAESRLSGTNAPQFLKIRGALSRDIDRLRSMPALDAAGLSLDIDRLIAGIDAMPLASEGRIQRTGAPEPESATGERGFLALLGTEIWKELRQLIVVRRIGASEPPLLAPAQAYFLRENLRLRLLNARLSALLRDQPGFSESLRASQAWIRRYFDSQSAKTQEALSRLSQLSGISVSPAIPSIQESIDAVRGFKARHEPGS